MFGICQSFINCLIGPSLKDCEPLFLKTVEKGDFSKFQQYVKAGVSLKCHDFNGETALHIAAREGHLQMIQILLNKCPELIDMENSEQETPLFWASSESIKVLLDAGAKIEHKDMYQQTVITRLINFKRKEDLELVLKTYEEQREARVQEALSGLVIGDVQGIILKYDSGIINTPDKFGHTPLFHAVRKDFRARKVTVQETVAPAIVKLLIDYGADPGDKVPGKKGQITILDYVKSLKGPTRQFIKLFEQVM